MSASTCAATKTGNSRGKEWNEFRYYPLHKKNNSKVDQRPKCEASKANTYRR